MRKFLIKVGSLITAITLVCSCISMHVFAMPGYTFENENTDGLVPATEVLFCESFEKDISVQQGALWGDAPQTLSIAKNDTTASVENGSLIVKGAANAEKSLNLKSDVALKGKFAVEFKFKMVDDAAVPLLFGVGYGSEIGEKAAIEIGVDKFTATDKFIRNLTYKGSDQIRKPLVDQTSSWRTMMDFDKWFLLHGDGNSWAPYSRDWYTLKTVIDTESAVYSVFLNGSLCLKDEPFADSENNWNETGINLPFMMTTGDSDPIKYDDIKIYREPNGRTTYYANDFNSYAAEESWNGTTSYRTQRMSLFAGVAGLGLANMQSKGGYIYARNNTLVTEYRNGCGGAFAGFLRMDNNMTIDTDFTVKSFADDSYQDNYATVLVLTPVGADGIRFAVSKDGKFIYYYYNRTIPYMPTILSNITMDKPHHLTLYMDFETYTCDVYIDGELIANNQNLMYNMNKRGTSGYYKDGEDMTIGLGYHKESPTTDIIYDNLRIYKDEREKALAAAAKELKGIFSGTYTPKGEVTLPNTINGYSVKWESNSPVIKIADNGITAAVKPKEEETVVRLTAHVADNKGEYALVRSFSVTVAADDDIKDLSSLENWHVVKGEPLLAANPANEADKTVKITDNAEAYTDLQCLGSKEEITAELYMDKKSAGNIYLADKNGNALLTIKVGKFAASTNPGGENNTVAGFEYPSKKWFALSFRVDLKKRSYDIYVDGKKQNNAPVQFDFSKTASDNGEISRMGFECEDGGFFVNDVDNKALSLDEGLEIRKIIYSDADGNTYNAPQAGRNVSAAEISNTFAERAAVIFAAVYDDNGRMLAADKVYENALPKGITQIKFSDIKIPAAWNGNYSVKAFVWSDQASLAPLTDTHGENLMPTVYIVGDSSAADYKTELYPYTGWGTEFKFMLDDSVNVVNMARTDCTTEAFIAAGTFESVKTRILPGDYLFIAFGNDDAENGISESDYRNNLIKLVTAAQQNGAKAVIVTPAAVSEKDVSAYAEHAKAVAAKTGAKLLDLNRVWSNALSSAEKPEAYYGKYIDAYVKSDLKWPLSSLNPESSNYDEAQTGKKGRFSFAGAQQAASLLANIIKSSQSELSSAVTDERNVTYSVSGSELTVEGSGEMPLYTSFSQTPWANLKNIDTIRLRDGITAVSSNAFSGFDGLSAVYMPDSVCEIYPNAFPENGKCILYGSNNSAAQRLSEVNPNIGFKFKKLRILAIGNSHTHDYMNWRDLIFADLKKAGLKTEIEFDYAIVGGAQLYYKDIPYVGVEGEYRSHYTQGSNKNRAYYNVYSMLRDKNYDLVLVQDYRESVMDKYRYSFAQDLTKVVRWIKNEQPNADVAWVSDWTDMNSTGARERLLNQWEENSVSVMKSVEALADDQPDFVVPMSTALQNARSSYLGSVYNAPDCYGDNSNTDWNGTNGIDKFTILERDGTHCSYELGRYLVSAAVFGKVFDVYKDSMDGLDFEFFDALETTPEYVTNNIYPWNGSMTENHMEIVRESAENALRNPHAVTQSAYTEDPADAIADKISKLTYTLFTNDGIAAVVNGASLGITVTANDVSISADGLTASITFLHGYTKKTVTVNK